VCSAGLKNRIGYGRINVIMADFLAGHGYPVMRFDYHGCGDSQGHLSPTGEANELHADINGFIQTGLFTGDALNAIEVLKERAGCKSFILSGLCGGSNTSLYTAVKSDEVVSVILLNLPVALDSNLARQERAGEMSEWHLKFMYESYLKKIFSPRAWLRLLSFKSDFSAIGKVLKSKFSKGNSSNSSESSNEEKKFNFNDDLLVQFEKYFKSGRKAYFVFADNDPLKNEFETYFENDKGAHLLDKYRENYYKKVIKDSNHSFTEWNWREQLFEEVLRCINQESKVSDKTAV
jgi:pimeloyl-ACP methyl ester carboxylesterase